MPFQGPLVAGLGLAGLVAIAPPSRALAPTDPKAAPILQARNAQDAAGNDEYNYIAGLFEKGFHELVIAEAKKFLAAHPEHPRVPLVRYRLGQSLFESKKFEEARTELGKLEPPPKDFEFALEVSFRLGQCALELGQTAEAARRFDQIAATGANHYLAPAANYFAGEAHFKLNEFPAAAKAYAATVKDEKSEYARGALYGLCWSLYKAGEFAPAADSLQLFLQRHPKDAAVAEMQFLLGECQLRDGKADAALASFQKVPQGEWYDDALSGAGFAAADLKDDAQAAQHFLRLEQATPDSPLLPEARLHAGIHLQRLGRDDDAGAVLDRLLAGKSDPYTAEACYWRGLVERKKGGPAKALVFFEKGLAAKPAPEVATRLAHARADALFDAGRFDEAKEAYTKAAGGNEDDSYSAAVAALNGGDHPGAAQRARECLAAFPKGKHVAAVNLVMGEALFAQKKWADALPAFELAAQGAASAAAGSEDAKAGVAPRAYARAGWCFYRLEKWKEAAARFQKVVQGWPDDERACEASFMAGRSLLRGGDPAAAEQALEGHLQQFPKSAYGDDARYDLAQAEKLLNKGEDAARLLTRLANGSGKTDPSISRRAALENAELLANAGKHEEALQTLTAALAADAPLETQRSALYAQAWSCYALQRHDDAAKALTKLLATDTEKQKLPKEIASAALELQVSVARAKKDGPLAQAAWRRMVEVAPESDRTAEAAIVAALALDDAGDPKAGGALLADAVQRFPKFSGRDRMAWQRVLLAQKSNDPQLKELTAQFGRDFTGSSFAGEAAFELGEQLYVAGDFDGAFASYAKAQGEGSRVGDAALYKSGWCKFQKQQWKEAAGLFAQMPVKYAKSSLCGESLYLAGESLYRAGDFEGAIAPLGDFLKNWPKHDHRAHGLFRAGLCYGELGRFDECLDQLTTLGREFPQFELQAESDLWRGRALLATKRTNDALARFDAVIAADRGVLAARAHLGRGETLVAQGRNDDALGEFLKVSLLFSTEPEVARSLWLAGQCLERMGDKDKARARYHELLDQHGKTPEAKSAKARLAELEANKSF
jgi:TolA-binding protein